MSAGKTVLLVDDDREFVESNKDLLEAYGYSVRIAYDGAAGLAEAKRERPDVMILDVMMATQTEGFEIARKIPQIPELRDLPVLLVTGIRKDLRLPFGLETDESWLPVRRVLEKPIPPARLLAEIRNVLGEGT